MGREHNERVSLSGDCISMYLHTGTHIDALNHFGYCGEFWNGVNEREHLGARHWSRNGVEKHPPVIARGVLIDVAAAHGVDELPRSLRDRRRRPAEALDRQGTELRKGDVVLIRTGRMRAWHDRDAYLAPEPGPNREGAALIARPARS